jgi:co-chaperonin GroES (HSP10)
MGSIRQESFASHLGPTAKGFTCVREKVLIQLIVKPDQTRGGVLLPDIADHPDSPLGWVVGVGPDCKQVKVGDMVINWLNTVSAMICWDGFELMQLQEGDLAGVVMTAEQAEEKRRKAKENRESLRK